MKKLISLFLAAALAFSLAVPACAYSTTKQESAQLLYNLGLFKGTGTNANGTPIFELDRAPTRTEALVILIRLMGAEQDALKKKYTSPYKDVPNWAKSYVGYAYQKKLTNGVGGNLFGSTQPVTAAQFLTFLLRALGYADNTDFQWSTAWTLTDKLGITKGQYNKNTKTFLRGDAADTAASTLFAVRKTDGKTLLEYLLGVGAITGESVVWDCTPTALEADYAAFLFYPLAGSPSTFTSFKVSNVTVNGQSCETFQLTSPTAVGSYLISIGGEKGGFCYVELTYNPKAVSATTYKAPDGKTYPLLKFSFHYSGTQADGSKVSGSFTCSYYLDCE